MKIINYSIPKKLHYCWLSKEKMSKETIKCMDSWKRIMPDYELVLWDQNKFDITSVPFVEEACRVKKWAFACDYIRMYAIYQEGGVYMDTDVRVIKKFDRFLHHGFFSSREWPVYGSLQAAVFGGVKGHPFAKYCMDWYSDQHYILPDGQYYNEKYPNMLATKIFFDRAIEYDGYRNKNELQRLKENVFIYPSYIFPNEIKNAENRSYAVHLTSFSWDYSRGWKGVMEKVYKKLSHNEFLRKVLGYKTPLKRKTMDNLAIFESPSEEFVVNEDYQSTDFAKRDNAEGE